MTGFELHSFVLIGIDIEHFLGWGFSQLDERLGLDSALYARYVGDDGLCALCASALSSSLESCG